MFTRLKSLFLSFFFFSPSSSFLPPDIYNFGITNARAARVDIRFWVKRVIVYVFPFLKKISKSKKKKLKRKVSLIAIYEFVKKKNRTEKRERERRKKEKFFGSKPEMTIHISEIQFSDKSWFFRMYRTSCCPREINCRAINLQRGVFFFFLFLDIQSFESFSREIKTFDLSNMVLFFFLTY